MKKYIRRCVAAALIVCLMLCMTGCKREDDTIQPDNNSPVVRYFHDAWIGGLGDDKTYAFTIESRAQLEEHAERANVTKQVKIRHPEFLDPERAESGEAKPFIDYCQQYTDSFFEDKYLLIVYYSTGSRPYLIESQGLIFTPSGQLRVFLHLFVDKNRVGEDGSYVILDAGGSWAVVYELDRADGVVTSDQVSVVVDGSINALEGVIDPRLPANT